MSRIYNTKFRRKLKQRTKQKVNTTQIVYRPTREVLANYTSQLGTKRREYLNKQILEYQFQHLRNIVG